MQNNANEMAVFNTAIYVRLSKEDIVAAQSGRESNSITNHDVMYRGWNTPKNITS